MGRMRNSESGFAMLLVFAMASIVAISLYFALPRVAFESQRDKEQMLIDRGEQYKRSIQLFVRKNKRWPAKVEDLENTNGIRFLRRRYLDPMTGKDEWRPIHVGPTGVLTDSLIKKKDAKEQKSVDNFITELSPIGGGNDAGQGVVNPGLRKRPSDQTPQGSTDGNTSPNPGVIGPNGQLTGQQPNYPPGLVLPNSNGMPQQPQQPAMPANSSAQMGGITVLGGLGSSTPSPAPAAPPNNGTPNPFMQNGAQPQGQAPNQGGQTPGQTQSQMPGNASQLIQNLLTSPRPGGAPSSTGSPAAGGVQGGGIAGFASKFEGEGIKVYNDQDEYQKWEFVYDMSKDPLVSGQTGATPNATGQQGQNGANSQTGAGANTGFGGQSSFGQTGAGQSSFGQSGTGAGTTQTPVKNP